MSRSAPFLLASQREEVMELLVSEHRHPKTGSVFFSARIRRPLVDHVDVFVGFPPMPRPAPPRPAIPSYPTPDPIPSYPTPDPIPSYPTPDPIRSCPTPDSIPS